MNEVISALQAVHRGMEDNIYNFTKDGKCSCCGACCSNLLPMSEKEIHTIKKYIAKYKIKECVHFLPLVNPALDMTCPFRDNANKICTIYDVRPEICRQFICDSDKRAKHNRKLIGKTRKIIDIRREFYKSLQ